MSSRLKSIDSLRGIAAIAVVLYHAGGLSTGVEGLPPFVGKLVTLLCSFGYTGVILFFVISGFCIHLRYAKDGKVNFASFWKRRVKRLYPPYLVALILYLLLLVYTGQWRPTAFNLYDLVAHLLMLHNMDARTIYNIRAVFWTLAVEEQLYLLYFLLLFVRKRWGWTGALGFCLLMHIIWRAFCFFINPFMAARAPRHSFWELQFPVEGGALYHWFTWALGALAVEAWVGKVSLPRWCYSLTLGACLLVIFGGLTYAGLIDHWFSPAWGIGYLLIMNGLVAREKSLRVSAIAYVGLFSYSLYLTHGLILSYLAPASYSVLVSLLLLTPLSIAFAWAYFQICEKRFIPKPTETPLVARLRLS